MVHALAACASACAELDALVALAHHAQRNDWVAPVLTEQTAIEIELGRHPVVERSIERFTPNSCVLNAHRALLVITGPNMGGKSTYMRQVASSPCWRGSAVLCLQNPPRSVPLTESLHGSVQQMT